MTFTRSQGLRRYPFCVPNCQSLLQFFELTNTEYYKEFDYTQFVDFICIHHVAFQRAVEAFHDTDGNGVIDSLELENWYLDLLKEQKNFDMTDQCTFIIKLSEAQDYVNDASILSHGNVFKIWYNEVPDPMVGAVFNIVSHVMELKSSV